ncbi:MAG: DUF2808 domain-containing protein [Cyanobacteria bacterium P01_E01_bin.6]
MKPLRTVLTSISLAFSAVGLGLAAQGIQLADGTVFFEQPPSLRNATTTVRHVSAPNARYYFDLEIPSTAGEPLQRVTITQEGGSSFINQVRFEDSETQAFLGSRRRRGDDVAIASSIWDEASQTVTVEFASPVPPGTDVTIRLEPERNPRRAGVYLFGVTAFPSGEITHGQFLGYGRLHFSNSFTSRHFR